MSEHLNPLVTAAVRFAGECHAGTYRPDSRRTPFITHLSEVADLVAAAGGGPEEVAAAWLHDAVEDELVSAQAIAERFGPAVASLVALVTDPPNLRGQSIDERKRQQAERLAAASDGAKRIKLAEQISILRAMAVERPLSWTPERSVAYVEGAGRVAEICHGLSPALDSQFEAAAAAARRALGTAH